MDRFTKCSGCAALDGLEWVCILGYPIVATKVFKPLQECPKPVTDEELEDVQQLSS